MKNTFTIIIAGVIFIAGLAALIFNMQLKQEKAELALIMARIETVDKEIIAAKESLESLNRQNDNLESGISEFQNKITAYNTRTEELKSKKEQAISTLQEKRVQALSLKQELEKLGEEKTSLMQRFSEITSKNRIAVQEIEKLNEEKRQIEENIKKYIKPEKGVELDRIVVKLTEPAEGAIVEVNNKYGFAIVNIGIDNGVIVGDILEVRRNSQPVSRLIVEKVYKDMSSAVPTEGFTNVELEVSDQVNLIR